MKNIPYYNTKHIDNLKQMLNESCTEFKGNDAYYYKSEGVYKPIKYKQLKENVDAFGTSLIDLGLKDKKIAIIGENRYDWAISYLSVITGVGIVVPLDRQLPEQEIVNCIKRSKVSAIIYSGKLQEKIDYVKQNCTVDIYINMDGLENKDNTYALYKLIEIGNGLLENGNTTHIEAKINNEEMAVLLFTSGTTSESKAVMLSHKNICSNIINQNKMVNIVSEDIFLSILPLHHVYECTCGFLTPIYRGAAVAYCEGLKHIQNNIKESHASIILSVPLVFELIYKKIWQNIEKQGKTDLVKKMIKVTNFLDKIGVKVKKVIFKEIHEQLGGNIKILIAGAAAINPEVAKGYRDFGMLAIQGYGLSECAPIATLNRDVDFNDAAAGLPLPETEIQIKNPGEDGIGEIATKGDHVMLGYYENEKATKEVIQDGWLLTGDLGFIDEDGFVHITGRKKNVIITKNGKNVYPEELEILLNNNEYIKESMVYGKETAKDRTIAVQIIPDEEFIEEKFKNNPKNKEEIKKIIWEEVKKINQNLVIYKHITDIEIRDKNFEKTTTLKIKRYKENV